GRASKRVWSDEGGRLRRDDGLIVDVLPGALAADTVLTAGPAAGTGADRAAKRASQGLGAGADEVELGPEGLVFNSPALLTLPYDPARASAVGVDERKLMVYWWNGGDGQWQPLPSTVDRDAHVVTARTSHFSIFQVMGGGASPAAL